MDTEHSLSKNHVCADRIPCSGCFLFYCCLWLHPYMYIHMNSFVIIFRFYVNLLCSRWRWRNPFYLYTYQPIYCFTLYLLPAMQGCQNQFSLWTTCGPFDFKWVKPVKLSFSVITKFNYTFNSWATVHLFYTVLVNQRKLSAWLFGVNV